MPNPSDPSKDLSRLLSSPVAAGAKADILSPSDPSKEGTHVYMMNPSDPSKEGTRVMSFCPTDPAKDPTRAMSTILEGAGEPGVRPFGLPPLPLTEAGIQARADERQALLKAVKELVVRLNRAHLAGTLTPADLEMLQALQGWYSLLQAEQDAAKQRR